MVTSLRASAMCSREHLICKAEAEAGAAGAGAGSCSRSTPVLFVVAVAVVMVSGASSCVYERRQEKAEGEGIG